MLPGTRNDRFASVHVSNLSHTGDPRTETRNGEVRPHETRTATTQRGQWPVACAQEAQHPTVNLSFAILLLIYGQSNTYAAHRKWGGNSHKINR